MAQKIIFTDEVAGALREAVSAIAPNKVFILTDTHTAQLAHDLIPGALPITIPAGDVNKNITSLTHVWEGLCRGGATRRSLLVNLGGGMVTDLGGFAAATFKRGIAFINVPTTLLAAVDAAVGGKTGINFLGFKNEVGAFREADTVIISTRFFTSLPAEELLSGYGEMIKHGLLDSPEAFARLLAHDVTLDTHGPALLALLEQNVGVKRRVVAQDPTEKGIRKALNLGHTPGHAFESWAMAQGSPVPHGYAVAWGLVVDLILSNMLLHFPGDILHTVAATVKERYGSLPIGCNDYDALLDYMRHDKKNATADGINFTLLDAPGRVHIDCIVPDETIRQALDIFRDLTQ